MEEDRKENRPSGPVSERRTALRNKVGNPMSKAARKPKSLRMAINAKCFDCSGWNRAEVTRCVVHYCPLWPVRPWQRGAAIKAAALDSPEDE